MAGMERKRNDSWGGIGEIEGGESDKRPLFGYRQTIDLKTF